MDVAVDACKIGFETLGDIVICRVSRTECAKIEYTFNGVLLRPMEIWITVVFPISAATFGGEASISVGYE